MGTVGGMHACSLAVTRSKTNSRPAGSPACTGRQTGGSTVPSRSRCSTAGRVATADPGAMQRFVREARSSAGFTHPHAVTVFDAGEADGELFIVMELVDGPSLAESIADRGSLPEDDAVRIATQVLSALGAAHASGIVHRDVKPANILLDAARRCQARRLRYRQALRRPHRQPHRDRADRRHTAVPLARAGPRRAALAGHRHLRRRRDPARDARRRAAVRRREPAGHRQPRSPPDPSRRHRSTRCHAAGRRRRRRALAPDPADRFGSATR